MARVLRGHFDVITPARDFRTQLGFVDEFDRLYVVRHDLNTDMEQYYYVDYYVNAAIKLSARKKETGGGWFDERRLSLDHPSAGDELYLWDKKPGQYRLRKQQADGRKAFQAQVRVESVETSGSILRAVRGREPKHFHSDSLGLLKVQVIFGEEHFA